MDFRALVFAAAITPALFAAGPGTPRWIPLQRAGARFLSFVDHGEQVRSGYPFYLPFPASTEARPAPAVCTDGNSPYDWWRLLADSATDPNPKWTWSSQPDSEPFYRDPSSLHVSRGVFQGVRGLRFTGSFGGRILRNTDPSPIGQKHSNLVQAIFVHQRFCYDGGPEMGFVRVMINPSNQWEEGRLYFYLSENTNCFSDPNATQTSCFDRATKTWKLGSTIGVPGAFPVPDPGNPNYWWLPLPCYSPTAVANVASPRYAPGAPLCENAAGTRDWTFSARLNEHRGFVLEIFDPAAGVLVYRKSVEAGPAWQTLTRAMSKGEFWGYLTLTIQKSLGRDRRNHGRGDITPDPADSPAIAVTKIEVLTSEFKPQADRPVHRPRRR
jgi:hypothetical protein